MNLQHLSYMIEIENCNSISRAAQKLFVTQPYLSKILRELENQYGIAIFTRSRNGIIPTESGRLFLDMARDLLENAENFSRVFQEYREGYRLRVSSCTCSHASDAFIRMVQALPDETLRFHFRETLNMEVIDDVYTNVADVGVLLFPCDKSEEIKAMLHAKHLECHRLLDSPSYLFCRVGHPLLSLGRPMTDDDIYQYNFVLYPEQTDQRARTIESVYGNTALRALNWNRIRQVVYVHSRSALHNMIQRTDYLGLGMSPILEQEKNYHIVSFPYPETMLSHSEYRLSTLSYIHQKDRELSKAARVYITFLKQCYGEHSGYETKAPATTADA